MSLNPIGLWNTLKKRLLYNHAMQIVREVKLPQGVLLRLIQGDITQSRVDVIVNAANAQLQHGGGVAAAIARAGGPLIQAESDAWIGQHGPISHDTPALTSGGKLNCTAVIHVVGPIWGEGDEKEKLSTTIASALTTAGDHKFRSLAMPAVSTGIYGFPTDLAATVIFDSTLDFLQVHPHTTLEQIEMILFDTPSLTAFMDEFDQRWEPQP